MSIWETLPTPKFTPLEIEACKYIESLGGDSPWCVDFVTKKVTASIDWPLCNLTPTSNLDLVQFAEWIGWHNPESLARFSTPREKVGVFEVIPTNTPFFAGLAPSVRVCNDGSEINHFVQVVSGDERRVIATFPYVHSPSVGESTKKRAIAMAVKFVEGMCWYCVDVAESMRKYEAMRPPMTPERAARFSAIADSMFSAIIKEKFGDSIIETDGDDKP